MNRNARRMNSVHLTPDELELCLDRDAPWGRSAWVHDHLRECDACQTDLEFIDALDRRLVTLPREVPTPGFHGRVMARVELPASWHAQLTADLRAHWRAVAATATVLLMALGGMGYWLFGEQGLTPVDLAGVVIGGLESVALRALMASGRLLYNLGLVDLGSSIMQEPVQVFSALALFGTLSVLALLATTRLMRNRAPQLQPVLRW